MFNQIMNLRCCFAEIYKQRNKNLMPFFSPYPVLMLLHSFILVSREQNLAPYFLICPSRCNFLFEIFVQVLQYRKRSKSVNTSYFFQIAQQELEVMNDVQSLECCTQRYHGEQLTAFIIIIHKGKCPLTIKK